MNYASVGFDNFTDRFGSEVSLTHGASLKSRLGLALDYQTEWQDAEGRKAGTTLYGITNLAYEFLDRASVAVSGTGLKFAGQNSALNSALAARSTGPTAPTRCTAKCWARPPAKGNAYLHLSPGSQWRPELVSPTLP